jgi:murein DD-endopeptidase MepM/ murein hydrolase activator NlpD
MVIPQKSGGIIRFRVSSLFLKIATVIGVVTFLVSCMIFYDYLKIREKGRMQKLFSKQLLLQRFEFQEINNRLNHKTKQLQKLEEFDKKLRLISGLQDSISKIQYTGRINNSLKNYISDFVDSKQILEKMKNLYLNAKIREVSFFQLDAFLQESKDRLARTPSILPTRGHFTAGFGMRLHPIDRKKRFHHGVDWANKPYTPIYAPADGLVVNTYINGGFGRFLVINHGYNIITRYGHLAKYEVRVGQRVKRGDLIARMGNTGKSTGPHLHYEILLRDQYVDPMKYILDVNR